ncbi:unnamed protein product, partial [Prorocentrum cordatum]
ATGVGLNLSRGANGSVVCLATVGGGAYTALLGPDGVTGTTVAFDGADVEELREAGPGLIVALAAAGAVALLATGGVGCYCARSRSRSRKNGRVSAAGAAGEGGANEDPGPVGGGRRASASSGGSLSSASLREHSFMRRLADDPNLFRLAGAGSAEPSSFAPSSAPLSPSPRSARSGRRWSLTTSVSSLRGRGMLGPLDDAPASPGGRPPPPPSPTDDAYSRWASRALDQILQRRNSQELHPPTGRLPAALAAGLHAPPPPPLIAPGQAAGESVAQFPFPPPPRRPPPLAVGGGIELPTSRAPPGVPPAAGLGQAALWSLEAGPPPPPPFGASGGAASG